VNRILLCVVVWLGGARCVRGTNFWLSSTGDPADGSGPPVRGEDVERIDHHSLSPAGAIFVWARPDPGKTLFNWSLRLLSSNPGVLSLTSSSVDSFNPILGNTGSPQFDDIVRWEFVDEPTGAGPSISDIQGLNIFQVHSTGVGIGPGSQIDPLSDPFYNSRHDAWLLAQVNYELSGSPGETHLFLQIGSQGLNNQGEFSHQTDAVFGAQSDAPLNGESDRMQSSQTADAIISWTSSPTGDFDGDRDVDGVDLLIWQRGFGLSSAAHSQGDADGDGQVTQLDWEIWEQQFDDLSSNGLSTSGPRANGPSGPSHHIPEPGTLGMLLGGLAAILRVRRPAKFNRRSGCGWSLAATRIVVFGCAACFVCGPSGAATISWDTIADGLFSDPTRWNPMQVPTTDDVVVFDLASGGAGYTVSFDRDETSSQLIVKSDEVTLDLMGSVYTLVGVADLNPGVTVGDLSGDEAELHLTNGLLVSHSGVIGNRSGAIGDATVRAGTSWQNDSFLVVGHFGDGTLDISNGGIVSNSQGLVGVRPASTGVVTVRGTGSRWSSSDNLTLGDTGSGTLQITDGAAVENIQGLIGNEAFSSGIVRVDGTGSTWTNQSLLTIGNQGAGTLQITSGAIVSNTQAKVGDHPGAIGTVSVDGIGSRWANRQNVFVGGGGIGTVNITGGATVSAALGILGTDLGSTGVVNLAGDGSQWESSDNFFVGSAGSGTLNIMGGAEVMSFQGGIAQGASSSGLVTVSGGGSTWTTSSYLRVGMAGNGSLNIANGGTVRNEFGQIGEYPGSQGQVNVDGAGSSWNNNSFVRVGNGGSGTLRIANGGTVINDTGFIAYEPGATGVVTVDGIGSTWVNQIALLVGRSAAGTLNITGGGTVLVATDTLVGVEPGSSGDIFFDSGTLSTGGFLGRFDDLTGTGVVNANGLVSDLDLVLDTPGSLSQTLLINDNPGQNVTFNLNVNGAGAMGAGYRGTGTLSISNGVDVQSTVGYIGYAAGSTGSVAVSGIGSTWTSSNDLTVGRAGHGTLVISGGAVNVGADVLVGSQPGSSGAIVLDDGTLNTSGLLADLDDLSGTGVVNSNGLVSDIDLVFDSPNDLNQTFLVNEIPGQNYTLRLNVNGAGSLGAGYRGTGTMSISQGVDVRATEGYIGFVAGSTGVVTVDGFGSSWLNSGGISVGTSGNGTLNITGGGTVHGALGILGDTTGSNGVVNVDGLGSTWVNFSNLWVGFRGGGTLNITGGGGVASFQGIIGDNSSATSVVNVDGANSLWLNSSVVFVGGRGSGALHVTNGGTVDSLGGVIASEPDSTGAVTLESPGSTWTTSGIVIVGGKGEGTLEILGGATVTDDLGIVGDGELSAGEVLVRGVGSRWSHGSELIVGSLGAAKLNLQEGGLASSARGFIGFGPLSTSEVTVEGSGSRWTNSGPLTVGMFGNAALDITGGGSVSSTLGILGEETHSAGAVTVSGSGSTWTNDSSLTIGNRGDATLSIAGGGLVTSTSGHVAARVFSTSNVTVSDPGSRWNLSGSLNIGGERFVGGLGTLTLDGGTVEAAQAVSIGRTGAVRGKGTLLGDVINRGLIAPGFSPGIINIDGDFTQAASGVLEIEVGGLTPGTQHDQVLVTGTAALAGRLALPLIDLGDGVFAPQVNDEVTFLTAAAVTGNLDSLFAPNLATEAPGLAVEIVQSNSSVKIRFVPEDAANQFDGIAATSNWADTSNWTAATAPTSTNVITVDNVGAVDQRVEVALDVLPDSENAFTQSLVVEGLTHTMTLAVGAGSNLSAVSKLDVAEKGILELGGGTVVTRALDIQGGGELGGNGVIVGRLAIGDGGSAPATLSPGFSVGSIEVEGDFEQFSNGELVIEIEGTQTGEFDTLSVTGEAVLGGVVEVMVENVAELPVGSIVEVITAQKVTGTFDKVVTQGADDLYWAPIYSETAMALRSFEEGDMDPRSPGLGEEDAIAFALGLTDPDGYESLFGIEAAEAGDMDDDFDIDFDDIEPFVAALNRTLGGTMTTQRMIEIIRAAQAVPEPSGIALAWLGLALATARRCPSLEAAT
jgi:T5SS/PEP-CTERM-associated repeat protein